jgi:hypothetical protein
MLRATITRPPALSATATTKPGVVTLASGRVTLRRGGAKTVRLHLTAAGRRFAVSHHGKITLIAAVAVTVRGHTSVVKERLTTTITRKR